LKRGIRKYKIKLPLKYFKCGEIGHFSSKFPLKCFEKRNKEPRRNKVKSILYSMEDSFSAKYDDSSGLDNEDEIIFLVTKKIEVKSKGLSVVQY
jgi:hypothetical protein